jgi:hypothetical protein
MAERDRVAIGRRQCVAGGLIQLTDDDLALKGSLVK